MKLMIGFTAGLVAGAYGYSKLTEEQRREVAGKLDALIAQGRSGDVVTSVKRNAGQVADAVTDRVTDATDSAGAAATDAVSGVHAPA